MGNVFCKNQIQKIGINEIVFSKDIIQNPIANKSILKSLNESANLSLIEMDKQVASISFEEPQISGQLGQITNQSLEVYRYLGQNEDNYAKKLIENPALILEQTKSQVKIQFDVPSSKIYDEEQDNMDLESKSSLQFYDKNQAIKESKIASQNQYLLCSQILGDNNFKRHKGDQILNSSVSSRQDKNLLINKQFFHEKEYINIKSDQSQCKKYQQCLSKQPRSSSHQPQFNQNDNNMNTTVKMEKNLDNKQKKKRSFSEQISQYIKKNRKISEDSLFVSPPKTSKKKSGDQNYQQLEQKDKSLNQKSVHQVRRKGSEDQQFVSAPKQNKKKGGDYNYLSLEQKDESLNQKSQPPGHRKSSVDQLFVSPPKTRRKKSGDCNYLSLEQKEESLNQKSQPSGIRNCSLDQQFVSPPQTNRGKSGNQKPEKNILCVKFILSTQETRKVSEQQLLMSTHISVKKKSQNQNIQTLERNNIDKAIIIEQNISNNQRNQSVVFPQIEGIKGGREDVKVEHYQKINKSNDSMERISISIYNEYQVKY